MNISPRGFPFHFSCLVNFTKTLSTMERKLKPIYDLVNLVTRILTLDLLKSALL